MMMVMTLMSVNIDSRYSLHYSSHLNSSHFILITVGTHENERTHELYTSLLRILRARYSSRVIRDHELYPSPATASTAGAARAGRPLTGARSTDPITLHASLNTFKVPVAVIYDGVDFVAEILDTHYGLAYLWPRKTFRAHPDVSDDPIADIAVVTHAFRGDIL